MPCNRCWCFFQSSRLTDIGTLTTEITPIQLKRDLWVSAIPNAGKLLEPNLTTVPEHAYHVAGEGMVEPLAAADALLAAARALSASTVM